MLQHVFAKCCGKLFNSFSRNFFQGSIAKACNIAFFLAVQPFGHTFIDFFVVIDVNPLFVGCAKRAAELLLEQSGEVDPVGLLQHFIPEIENLLDMLVDFIASCTAIVDDAFFKQRIAHGKRFSSELRCNDTVFPVEIDIRQIARLAAEVLAGVLQAEVRCLCLDENEQPAALYGARPGQSAVPLSGDETAVNDKTGLPPSGDTVELPLQNNGIRLAVLQIPLETMNTISEADKQLVQSLSETITLAMDRFRTAKQKIRSEEEAAQERYRSNLLRAISHDLRTPLSAIMGSAEMIRGMSQENDPRYDLAQDIYQDADWLHSLVENILSLTRIQDGHLNLHLEKEAAEEIIASALDHIAKRAPQRTIQVSIPDEVLMIPMDGKLIQQVLINLLDNALKHTRPQEEITLTLRREQNEAVFTVEDEGEGIAEKDLEHIFQTFYTTRTRRADAQHGIGLGLPICESIVQAHHGTISARNRTDGHGAEFTFRLPLEETR